MTWDQQELILEWLTDATKHWWLAFAVAVLAYLWMRIILYVLYSAGRALSKVLGVGWFMRILSLLFALSLALLSHWALDYFSVWWETPLGPGLELSLEN